MIAAAVMRYSAVDPGYVRTRRSVQTVGAAAATWVAVSALTSLAGVPANFRIALFGAGTCLYGALLITDPHPRGRSRSFGWAAVVTAVSLALTVYLVQVGVWAAAAFLVAQMVLSFALQAYSVRAGSLAGIGALTTFVASGGHISADRIGWFMMASTIGFTSLAIWQRLILPGQPDTAARRAIRQLHQLAADVLASAGRTTHPGRSTSESTALRTRLGRVITCRKNIDLQLSALTPDVVRDFPLDEMRVAIYTLQAALERLVDHVEDPRWTTTVGDAPAASSISALLEDAAKALTDPDHSAIASEVTSEMQRLRAHHEQTSMTGTAAEGEERVPSDATLTIAAILDAVDLVIESATETVSLESSTCTVWTQATSTVSLTPRPVLDSAPRPTGLRPTTALAMQAVVASVCAGLVALWAGVEQSRVVAYTAFLVIAGSAGATFRRAWTRVVATVIGATAGVVIAASVPRNPVCIGAVFLAGVFFTVFTAPVSHAAMVFWLSIATVPQTATDGLYLDLVKDQTLAALIGGGIAAVVVSTVAPIRLSQTLGAAMVTYLNALDTALATLLPLHHDRELNAVAEPRAAAALDRAYAAFDAAAASAEAEIHLFPRPGDSPTEQRMRIAAAHVAYLRVAPLFDESSTRMLGWTHDDLDNVIQKLRTEVDTAISAVCGHPSADEGTDPGGASTLPFAKTAGGDHVELTLRHRRIDDLRMALAAWGRA